MSSILILSKNAVTPATPAADKIGIYVDSNENLAQINDLGAVKLWMPWTTTTAWTPGLSFGGGTTGLTYTTRLGFYEQIASRIFFTGYMLLSSKGSSTGVVLITGLPVAANATANYFQPVGGIYLDTMASISGNIQSFISPGGTTIRLEHLGTGTSAQLTHANFNNTSTVIVNGFYQV